MKKTIAKIMAAAMVLSTIPAVALPSLTADAAYVDTDNARATLSKLNVKQGSSIIANGEDSGKKSAGSETAPLTLSDTTINYDTNNSSIVASIDTDITVEAAVWASASTVPSFAAGAKIGQEYLLGVTPGSIKGEGKELSSIDIDKDKLDKIISVQSITPVSPSTAGVFSANKTKIDDRGKLLLYVNDTTYAQNAINNVASAPITIKVTLATNTALGSKIFTAVANNTNGVKDLNTTIDLYLKVAALNASSTSATGTGNGTLEFDLDGVTKTVKATVVTDDAAGTAELVSMDDTSKKVTLKGANLNLNTVKVGSKEYNIVKVRARALKEAKVKNITAENLKHINQGAFRKCKQLKKINLGTDRKIRKIHAKAFYGDEKLATIKLDGRNLKEVGSKAFQGVKKNCTIKVKGSKAKYNAAVKKLKKGVGTTKVKFTRI